MKKIIIILFAFMAIVLLSNKTDEVIIPKSSIRYRIIANSNDKDDQILKLKINEDVLPIIIKSINEVNNIDEAKTSIKNSILNIKKILDNYNVDYQINYGNNYFPQKKYKNVLYEQGNYESLVISLDKAKGDNFWCVLFPPLCLIDTNNENVEYESYVKKIINKYK